MAKTTNSQPIHAQIASFRDLIRWKDPLGLVEYDVQEHTSLFTGLDEKLYTLLFSPNDFQAKYTRRLFDSHAPLFIMNDLGIVCFLVSHYNDLGEITYYCALGPAFLDQQTKDHLTYCLSHTSSYTVADKLYMQKMAPYLPVVSMDTYVNYVIMLHGCMNREQISPGDIHYIYSPLLQTQEPFHDPVTDSSYPTAYAVKARQMQIAIAAGDVDFFRRNPVSLFAELPRNNAGHISPLRLTKDFCIMISANCCNASVHGGLPVTTAYDILENYLFLIETKDNINDLYDLLATIEMDFAKKVKKIRLSDSSPLIDACEYYIDTHLTLNINLRSMASDLGYSPNHLGKIFTETLGISFRSYVEKKRLHLAKDYLLHSEINCSQIADLCGFSSASYFSKVFKEKIHMTPQEFRRSSGTKPSSL